MLTIKAPAKLNMVLEVLGKRPDGYHEIRSIMQTIDLFDTVYLRFANDISLETSAPAVKGTDNTVIVAAKALKKGSAYPGGASIQLEKRIPWGMGLGGGSSDAAAVLIGLNALWELKLNITELMNLASTIGSDVPFFILGGTALVEGRGERVTPMPSVGSLSLVVVVPKGKAIAAKTKHLYSLLSETNYSDGHWIDRASAAMLRGDSVTDYYNTFEQVAFEAFPGLKEDWLIFATIAECEVHLCGSGPGLFAVVDNNHRAKAIAGEMIGKGYRAYAVDTLGLSVVDALRSRDGNLA